MLTILGRLDRRPSEAWKDRSDSDRKYQEISSHCRKFTPLGAFEGGVNLVIEASWGVNYATYGTQFRRLRRYRRVEGKIPTYHVRPLNFPIIPGCRKFVEIF